MTALKKAGRRMLHLVLISKSTKEWEKRVTVKTSQCILKITWHGKRFLEHLGLTIQLQTIHSTITLGGIVGDSSQQKKKKGKE